MRTKWAARALLAASLVISQTGFADDRLFYLGGGVFAQDAERVTVTTTGGTSLMGNTAVDLTAAFRFNLDNSWGLSVVGNYTPFGANGADPNEKTRLLTADIRGSYSIAGIVEFHVGPGVLWDTISGSGGTENLSNGSGTAEFGLPSASSTSRMFYLEAGLAVKISPVRVDVDALVTDTFTSRRAVYPMLTASVGLF